MATQPLFLPHSYCSSLYPVFASYVEYTEWCKRGSSFLTADCDEIDPVLRMDVMSDFKTLDAACFWSCSSIW